jgi:hypothetical protein
VSRIGIASCKNTVDIGYAASASSCVSRMQPRLASRLLERYLSWVRTRLPKRGIASPGLRGVSGVITHPLHECPRAARARSEIAPSDALSCRPPSRMCRVIALPPSRRSLRNSIA